MLFATALTLATSSVAIAVPAKANNTLSDVSPTSVFYGPIMDLFNRGIISGFPDFTYRPNGTLTRGQAAKIMAKVLELPTPTTNATFTDVSVTHEFYPFIMALKENGIIDGFPDGSFKLHQPITRNQMAKMIANAFELQAESNTTVPFTDIMSSYREPIAALYAHAVTVGKTPTLFDGGANVTRAQMAAFVSRAEIVMKEKNKLPFDLTFINEGYSEDGIMIRGKTYAYSDAVKSIFTEENRIALTNAEFTLTVEDGVITKVSKLSLNHPGTKDDVVTFAAEAEIDYLYVNANYVIVRDVTVLRGAVASSTVDEAVYFEDANIRGILTVGETDVIGDLTTTSISTGPVVTLTGTTVMGMLVKANDTVVDSDVVVPQLQLDANIQAIDVQTDVGSLQVNSARDIDLIGEGDVERLTLARAVQLSLDMKGEVQDVTVLDKGAKLTLGSNVVVKNYTLPDGMNLSDFVTNAPTQPSTPSPSTPITLSKFQYTGQMSYAIAEGEAFTLPAVLNASGQVVVPTVTLDVNKQGKQQITFTQSGYTPLTIEVTVGPKRNFKTTSASTITVAENSSFTPPVVTDIYDAVVTPIGNVDITKAGAYTLTYTKPGYHALAITVNVEAPKQFTGTIPASLQIDQFMPLTLPSVTDDAGAAVTPKYVDATNRVITAINTSSPGTYKVIYEKAGYDTKMMDVIITNVARYQVKFMALSGKMIDLDDVRIYQYNGSTKVDVDNKQWLKRGKYFFTVNSSKYVVSSSYEVEIDVVSDGTVLTWLLERP